MSGRYVSLIAGTSRGAYYKTAIAVATSNVVGCNNICNRENPQRMLSFTKKHILKN